MEQSEQINELAAALSKAQASIGRAVRDSDNPFYKSKYADLASVADACFEALTANGLSVIQGPESNAGVHVSVSTMLCHSSGQWVKSVLTLLPVKQDPQGMGSCITYARRYALAAMCGVAPEDDDGNAALGVREAVKSQVATPPPGIDSDGLEVTLQQSIDRAKENRAKLVKERGIDVAAPPLDFDQIEANVKRKRELGVPEICTKSGCQAHVMTYTSKNGRAYFQCHAAHTDFAAAMKMGLPKSEASAKTKDHFYQLA